MKLAITCCVIGASLIASVLFCAHSVDGQEYPQGIFRLDREYLPADELAPAIGGLRPGKRPSETFISNGRFSPDSKHMVFRSRSRLRIISVKDRRQLTSRTFINTADAVFCDNDTVLIYRGSDSGKIVLWKWKTDEVSEFIVDELKRTTRERDEKRIPACTLIDCRPAYGEKIFFSSRAGLGALDWKSRVFTLLFSLDDLTQAREEFWAKVNLLTDDERNARKKFLEKQFPHSRYWRKVPSVMFSTDDWICLRFDKQEYCIVTLGKTNSTHFVCRHVIGLENDKFVVDAGQAAVDRLSIDQLKSKKSYPANICHYGWFGMQGNRARGHSTCIPIAFSKQLDLIVDEYDETDFNVFESYQHDPLTRVTDAVTGNEILSIVPQKNKFPELCLRMIVSPNGEYVLAEYNGDFFEGFPVLLFDLRVISEK